jgi:hypothetical protein
LTWNDWHDNPLIFLELRRLCRRCGQVDRVRWRPGGAGGVKIVTTDTTGKIGTAGCSFICRRRSRPGSDAAFPRSRARHRRDER